MAERRTRGVVCKRCRGNVEYETYTEECWRRLSAVSTRENKASTERPHHIQHKLSYTDLYVVDTVFRSFWSHSSCVDPEAHRSAPFRLVVVGIASIPVSLPARKQTH